MTERVLRAIRRTALALALGVIAAAPVSASPIQYTYDAAGRLVRAADVSGNVVEYVYDTAGNLLEVRRAGGVLAVLDFSPKSGVVGDHVTITGSQFDPVATSVSFTGANSTVVNATVVSATSTVIVVTVPNGVVTGPLTVTTSKGSVVTTDPFIVGRVTVTPVGRILAPGAPLQFTAALSAGVPPGVRWSVDGIPGGSSSVGTITGAGLYTAPNGSIEVTVRATSTASSALFGEAQLIVDPIQADSDGDGWPDVIERQYGSDPFDPNSTPFLFTAGHPAVSVVAIGSDLVNGLPSGSLVAGHPLVSVIDIGSTQLNGIPVGSIVVGHPAVSVVAIGSDLVNGLPSGSIVVGHPLLSVIVLGLDASNSGPAPGTIIGKPSVSITIGSGAAMLRPHPDEPLLNLGMNALASRSIQPRIIRSLERHQR